jgi:hypothetical protein
MTDARENSVKQLSDLYNVVTGVALALAITKLIDADAPWFPIKSQSGISFLTFMVIIVPFHQGAVRHLYATYVEDGGSSRVKRGALALDFLILFAEACLFVALAELLGKPNLFATALIGLLIVDCTWGFLATLAFTGAQAQKAERKWSFINIITVALLVFLYIFGPKILDGWNTEMEISVFVLCLIRTVIDYYSCWDFYFPISDRESPRRRLHSRLTSGKPKLMTSRKRPGELAG